MNLKEKIKQWQYYFNYINSPIGMSHINFEIEGNTLTLSPPDAREMLEIIKKHQEIITELKTIIEYNDFVISDKKDEYYYKDYMSDCIEVVKNRIEKMEKIDI